MRKILMLLAGLIVFSPITAGAQIDYTYAGNPFTSIRQDPTGVYSLSDFVSVVVTVDSAIPQIPNSTVNATGLLGFSMSISDGARTINSPTTFDTATFSFDGDGNLSAWIVRAGESGNFTLTEDDSLQRDITRNIFFPECGSQCQADVLDNLGTWTGFVTAPPDTDDDGVNDDVDFCPDNTLFTESVPTVYLKPNHWALIDGDSVFDTVSKGPDRSYTIEETAGCSCEQIIDAHGLGNGHTKHGCSISAMDDWVEFVNQ